MMSSASGHERKRESPDNLRLDQFVGIEIGIVVMVVICSAGFCDHGVEFIGCRSAIRFCFQGERHHETSIQPHLKSCSGDHDRSDWR